MKRVLFPILCIVVVLCVGQMVPVIPPPVSVTVPPATNQTTIPALTAVLSVVSPMPATAGTYCDRAAAAGYNHPGLNLQCLLELIEEWYAENF